MMYGANIAAANIGVKFGGCGINLPKARMPEIYKNDSIIFIIVLPQPLLLNTVNCNTIYNTLSYFCQLIVFFEELAQHSMNVFVNCVF